MFCCNLSTWKCWCKKQTFQLNYPGTDIHAALALPDSVSPKEIMGAFKYLISEYARQVSAETGYLYNAASLSAGMPR